MELFEHKTKERVRREQAAERLRAIADELARQNEISFVRNSVPHTVRVPDEVDLKLEIEVGDEKSEIEIELSW